MTDSTSAALKRYAYGEWVVRNRWWVLLATLAGLTAVAFGMKFLSLEKDLRIYFSSDNPEVVVYDALEKRYVRNDILLLAIAPRDGDIFTRDSLSALETMTAAGWQMPRSLRVDSIINYQHTRADGDDLVVGDLVVDAETLGDAALAEIRTIALNEPTLVNGLISERGHVAAVVINLLKGEDGAAAVGDAMRHAAKMIAEVKAAHPDIDVYLSGGIAADAAFGSAAFKEFKTLWPIVFGIALVVLAVTLRAIFGTAVTMLVILMTSLVSLGASGWLGTPLNPTTIKAPILLLTLSVAHCVHILITLYQEMRAGRTKAEAIVESLRVNMQPVFVTSMTTAIGFLVLNFSDTPPFQKLGNMIGFGMMMAFVFSVTFLPAAMAVLPIRVKARPDVARAPLMDRLASLVIGRHRALFAGTLVAIVLVSSGMSRIDLDDNFIEYFDHRYDYRIHADFVVDNLTGLQAIEYSLPAGEDGGINDPEYLAKLDAFASWYRAQPTVVHVSALSDTIKRLNKNMHGDDPGYYTIPEGRELAAQYLLLYEMSLPYGLDLNNQIDVAKSSTRFVVTMANQTSMGLKRMEAKAQDWLGANAADLATPGSGLSMIFANLSERNIQSMLGGSILALVLISFILIVALRSLRIGLISLVPNLFPVAMAFGLWGFTVQEVGLAIATVVAMTLGIVVDDTVHFLSKYLRARREHGMDAEAAVRYAFNTVGTALVVTTVVLVLGFLVLGTSGYRPSSHIGWLSSITLVFALAADFLFLPPLLILLDRRSR
ncbi:MAG: efflux RND transporter permease subunit [Alphaproteobacteria bacterium]|nr:efflux RND transporter permease subunit [Alphaproteobacteria bacterium]